MTTTSNHPARSPLERALFAAITRGWDAHKIDSYEATLRQRDQVMSTEVSYTFGLIDAKATGLLTHTSMMIAGLGLVAPLVAENRVEIGIVVIEMGVYLLIALGCLRCLSVFSTHESADTSEGAQAIIHRELIIRSELYSLCIRSAIVFTIIVFLMLPVLFFWPPGKPA